MRIKAGDGIILDLSPANWDETVFPHPDRLDLQRPASNLVAFGFGPHVCLGQHLARMETTVALNALFDRLPNLRLDPEAEEPHVRGLMFRSPSALPVVFG